MSRSSLAFAICLGVFAISLAPFSVADEAATAETMPLDAEKLLGTWSYIKIVKAGEEAAKERMVGKVVVTKDKLTLKGEQADFVMKYELDTTKLPATIQLTIVESPFGEGAKAHGIIDVKDDQMQLCYAGTDTELPKQFESPAGSETRLIVLKRDAE